MHREISAGSLGDPEIDRDPPPPILNFNHWEEGRHGLGRLRDPVEVVAIIVEERRSVTGTNAQQTAIVGEARTTFLYAIIR